MTTTYATIAATKTNDELHLAIYANHDVVHGDIGLVSDDEAIQAHAITTAAANELHTRALAEYATGGTESPRARRDRVRRTAAQCEITTLNDDVDDASDGYTRRMALDELHRRALALNTDRDDFLTRSGERTLGRILDGELASFDRSISWLITDGIASPTAILVELHTRALEEHTDRPHLVTRRAATHHLATLIREELLDGEEVRDLADAENAGESPLGFTWAGDRTYRFLIMACEAFDESGYDLLQSTCETVLGW